VAELALNDVEGHAFAGELDGMRMSELVRRARRSRRCSSALSRGRVGEVERGGSLVATRMTPVGTFAGRGRRIGDRRGTPSALVPVVGAMAVWGVWLRRLTGSSHGVG
jgi:hypothetical protein